MKESVLKVLLGSPVRQKNQVLREFLSGLEKLSGGDLLCVDYFFIDDNIEAESSRLLADFSVKNADTTLFKPQSPEKGPFQDKDPYLCDEFTHVWGEDMIWKVAQFKNRIIKKALHDSYDYLFLVDSDLVLQPRTLEHLVSLKKEIVSEIFWTRWEPAFPELPQVWMSDQYNLYTAARGENLTQEEMIRRVRAFIKQLRVPGVYPVGGLGACTLISKKALQSGVNFNEIPNISFMGEDRHFCIRAAALGFTLYVDTHYPARHLYRLSDLKEPAHYHPDTQA